MKLSLNELGDYISIFGFHEEMDYDRNILSEIFLVYDHNCHRYKLDDDNIFSDKSNQQNPYQPYRTMFVLLEFIVMLFLHRSSRCPDDPCAL